MNNIIHTCNKCKNNVDVMSVEESVKDVDGKQIAVVDITYICKECGVTEIETHYLYKLDN